MPEVPFHLTRNGRLFYERTMPELARQLARMNDLLERLVAAQKCHGATVRPLRAPRARQRDRVPEDAP